MLGDGYTKENSERRWRNMNGTYGVLFVLGLILHHLHCHVIHLHISLRTRNLEFITLAACLFSCVNQLDS